MKQSQCPLMDEQMNRMWVVDTWNITQPLKKDQNPVTYSNIDEPSSHYAN